jgi:tetratricopeptide (TPR) repeat protein
VFFKMMESNEHAGLTRVAGSIQLKLQGNQAMKDMKYDEAISFHTSALEHSPGNAILLANRAAAYHLAEEYESAKTDAQAAVAADPQYTKGWSRLGLVEYDLGDYGASAAAYRTGVKIGGTDLTRKGYRQATITLGRSTVNSDLDALTSLLPSKPAIQAGMTLSS